jgi:hypothetical protein
VLASRAVGAGSDHPAGTGDPGHLRQPGHWIGHEVHDQLGESEIEAVVGERETFSHGALHVDPGQAGTDGGDERGGRIHRADGAHTKTVHQLCGQSSRPASDVQRPLARLDLGQFHKPRSQRPGDGPMNRS